jgi:regulator of replication initiation timing
METLQILEQKIAQLIALVKELQAQIKALKTENASLMQSNSELTDELEQVKTSLMADQEVLEEEKALAKLAVDEIIKNIDSLVSNQDQL